MIYYTDGACSKNGSKDSSGGFGVVEVDKDDNIIWQFQDTKSPTTNNEMELMAILAALHHITLETQKTDFFKPIIYSDSAYCVNLINDWMYKWKENGWKRPKNQEVKNLEIIKSIYQLAHLASIQKVPGHSGVKWNEYVDGLATGRIKINEYTP
jgi:ribonuclease HI